jgi:hypothetical protein
VIEVGKDPLFVVDADHTKQHPGTRDMATVAINKMHKTMAIPSPGDPLYIVLANENVLEIVDQKTGNFIVTKEIVSWLFRNSNIPGFLAEIPNSHFIVAARADERSISVNNYITIGSGDRLINTNMLIVSSITVSRKFSVVYATDQLRGRIASFLLPEMDCTAKEAKNTIDSTNTAPDEFLPSYLATCDDHNKKTVTCDADRTWDDLRERCVCNIGTYDDKAGNCAACSGCDICSGASADHCSDDLFNSG